MKRITSPLIVLTISHWSLRVHSLQLFKAIKKKNKVDFVQSFDNDVPLCHEATLSSIFSLGLPSPPFSPTTFPAVTMYSSVLHFYVPKEYGMPFFLCQFPSRATLLQNMIMLFICHWYSRHSSINAHVCSFHDSLIC